MSTGDPLLLALERAYRERAALHAAMTPEASPADHFPSFGAFTVALDALWAACDAAWGPTERFEPCPVCGKVAHENWCSTQADY